MQVKLFVGNLPWSVGDAELEQIFARHGEVQSARVINDRDTGRSRGFGFVEIETADLAALIQATDGLAVDGRNIRVNQAEDKESGGRRSGGGAFLFQVLDRARRLARADGERVPRNWLVDHRPPDLAAGLEEHGPVLVHVDGGEIGDHPVGLADGEGHL